MVEVREARSDAAWALPRPSATASARLAKSTVSHSQRATAAVKPTGVLAFSAPDAGGRKGSAMASAVVSTAPMSTMNITGECHICRGSSFLNAPGRAARTWARLRALEPRGVRMVVGMGRRSDRRFCRGLGESGHGKLEQSFG